MFNCSPTELPRITNSSSDNREIVTGQDNLVYTCEFEGSPTPEISWFFNGRAIDPQSGVSVSDNTLTIASPQVTNSGIYQCIVTNEHGDAQASWLLEIRPSSKWTEAYLALIAGVGLASLITGVGQFGGGLG